MDENAYKDILSSLLMLFKRYDEVHNKVSLFIQKNLSEEIDHIEEKMDLMIEHFQPKLDLNQEVIAKIKDFNKQIKGKKRRLISEVVLDAFELDEIYDEINNIDEKIHNLMDNS